MNSEGERSAKENFLTEALCDLLNRLPDAVGQDFISTTFFEHECADIVNRLRTLWSDADKKEWRTRVRVDTEGRIRYPDLVLYIDDTPAVVVEVKIGAQFTDKQLASYGKWISENCRSVDWSGALILLTYTTEAPEDFSLEASDARYGITCRHICKWPRVFRWLRQYVAGADDAEQSIQIVLARELQDFLVEMGMASETIKRSDLAAAEVFLTVADRVRATFDDLRNSFDKELKSFTQTRKNPHIDYSSEAGSISDWNRLQSPPGTMVYVGWGIRFTELSETWGDNCSSHCAYVIVHDEDEKKLPQWKVPADWNFHNDKTWVLTVRPLHDLPSDPEQFFRELSEWMLAKIVEAKKFTSAR